MNREALNKAKFAAKEFLQRVADYELEAEKTKEANRKHCERIGHEYYDGEPNCPKESGAVKRASMDLTRTLVGVRKP